ncbi:hypothetical protein EWM64_g10653 [Hericium alpestre]|uniref:Zn(2)-C6 fungal-type domain-containing protein n=1 Tax=Hericium alpestre TaxID=135208 RepID=A0A4Y9ZIS8_9AGAM|nr:hypothetical protein EWM64_g10653 [Hericium alpestre]
MSATSPATTPAQDTAPPSILDTQQLQQQQQQLTQVQDPQLQQQGLQNGQELPRKRAYLPSPIPSTPFLSASPPPAADSDRRLLAKAPAVRRACTACHAGKTRCSEVLPCQSCLKRGLGNTCIYPDPDTMEHSSQQQTPAPGVSPFAAPPLPYAMQPPSLTHQQYYEYNGAYTGASTSTFRPNKRPRPLTEEEAAAITRNFSRGDFYVGTTRPRAHRPAPARAPDAGRGRPRPLHHRRVCLIYLWTVLLSVRFLALSFSLRNIV